MKAERKPRTAEQERLLSDGQAWRHWGPYLSERQWGTVREDYSDSGDAWNYFTHDMPVPAHISGARTASLVSLTTSSGSVLR